MTYYGMNTLFIFNQALPLINYYFNGKFKTQSMHCCKEKKEITEVPQFKRTITVERSICKNTAVIYAPINVKPQVGGGGGRPRVI